jgi:predicted ATP-grasp superfamily ATP-dependent carboligase
VVKDDLKKFHPNVADIPWPGTEIEEGSAIISVYGSGKTEGEADSSLHKNILEINGYIDRW